MQKIKINELKSHPLNDYFFDDMVGQKWVEFLESIKTSGVIEPIVVTIINGEKIVVSGHQRVRACRELGIEEIMVEVRIYDNEEKIIKDLIETNIRQRGDVSSSSLKMGRIIQKLEEIYEVRQGGDRKSKDIKSDIVGNDSKQQKLAEQLNMSVDSLNNYKKLTTLIPEIQDLVDDKISFSVASRVISKLSQEEQEQLLLSLDTTKKLTQKKVQEYIDEMKEEKDDVIADYKLKLQNITEEQRKKYQEKIQNLEIQIKLKNNKISTYETQKQMLERKANLNNEDAEKYKKLKTEIDFLTKQKTDLSRQISSATELSSLTVKLQNVLEKELAPIKFKRCIDVLNSSDIAVQNLKEIIEKLNYWISEMNGFILNKNVVIVENYKEI